jgi:hypothetical protein
MSPTQRYAKKQAKASKQHRHAAQERLARDRRQAQQAAKALQQALDDLGLPADFVEGKSTYSFELPDGRQVKGHDLQHRVWPWRHSEQVPGVRYARLRAISPTYGAVTLIVVAEPGEMQRAADDGGDYLQLEALLALCRLRSS